MAGRNVEALARERARKGEVVPEVSRAPKSIARETEGLITKLNAAARDLVEALDGNLPRDLETRYLGTEKSVYTSRLYGQRSQRFGSAIAARYESERLVRGRVDAFIRLFERLLDTLSTGPKGDEMVDASLGSESGKIYLMLAEAIGRMGGRG